MKLGVFDSGVGGIAVARALQITFPTATIITAHDKKNVPYGDKSPEEVLALTSAAIKPLLEASCDCIILACNTATAYAIEPLREQHPLQQFIGIEPMIKAAAELTATKTIAVCATPATLASNRYATLIREYGSHLEIIEPDCSQWAYWIENNTLSREHIQQTVTDIRLRGADVIVLGCTHYHWIKELITELAGDSITVIEPSEAVGRRVTALLSL